MMGVNLGVKKNKQTDKASDCDLEQCFSTFIQLWHIYSIR